MWRQNKQFEELEATREITAWYHKECDQCGHERSNEQNLMQHNKKVHKKIKSVTCVNRKQAMQQAYSDT